MKEILSEPEKSQITLLNVLLYNQWKHKNTTKKDTMFIIYKDKDNKKQVRVITDPDMDIYFVKPEYRSEFLTSREYYEIDKCYKTTITPRKAVNCIYNEMKLSNDLPGQRLKRIYEEAGYYGDGKSKKEVFKWPYTLMSDVDIVDYYWITMGYKYDLMESHTFNRSFLDIESAIYGLTSTEQHENLDPTNACTIIFDYDQNETPGKIPDVYTFLLRDHKKYPQQQFFEDHLDEFITECHAEFDKQTVTKEGKSKVINKTANYHIKLYDKEEDLLVAIFDTINDHRPDTLAVWNIAYDIPKLAARMEKNNLNYVDIMCDKGFPKGCRFVEMHIDDRAAIDISNRKTFIKMLSTTLYIDQMQAYAGLRKGQKAYGSNKLDNIANIELGMGKRDFAPGIDVSNAPIKDYWNFVLYNITDVWRQDLIDDVTNDTMAMIYDMNQMNCPIENLTKQTKYQKQIYYAWYLRKGFVPGNNVNINYTNGDSEDYQEQLAELREQRAYRNSMDDLASAEDIEDNETEDDTICLDVNSIIEDNMTRTINITDDIFEDSSHRHLSLPGATVGNPDFNIANGTELINGVASKHVFDYVMDEDYSSEYPWAKITRSISRSTQIGRLIIEHKISDRQCVLPLGQEKRVQDIKSYLPGGEFVADYISHDILSLANVWFNLPTIQETEQLFLKSLEDV